jgi:hypothetical protein
MTTPLAAVGVIEDGDACEAFFQGRIEQGETGLLAQFADRALPNRVRPSACAMRLSNSLG